MRTAQDILVELNAADESPRVEAKRSRDIGKSVIETVVVFVPEADVTQKPVYLKATGLPRGAFRRIGSTDQRCTDDDLWVLRGASQPQVGPDMAIVADARMEDFDPQALAEYRRLRAEANPQAEELGDENPDMLEALSAVRRVDDGLRPALASLGTPGSRLRNPAIAAILHELNWAETKGSGIRTMRRMAGEAGLPLPEFASDRHKNEFKVTLFLHHLLTEDDYAWLKALAGDTLSGDEAKALIYARETGAIDNTACRDFSGLDTLQASSLLRRLRDRGLLEKQGAGSRTHYTLTSSGEDVDHDKGQAELPLEGGKRSGEGGKPDAQGGKRTLPDLPSDLAARLPKPGQRLSTAGLRQLIRELCGWQPLRGEELATLLHKDLKYLRNKHLTEMMHGGELAFLFPESPNHALQAYTLPTMKRSGS